MEYDTVKGKSTLYYGALNGECTWCSIITYALRYDTGPVKGPCTTAHMTSRQKETEMIGRSRQSEMHLIQENVTQAVSAILK